MNKSEWLAARGMNEAAPGAKVRFWIADRAFEVCDGPCICADNPTGGDPLVIAKLAEDARYPVWKQYLQALIDAANQRFEQFENLPDHQLGEGV